MRRRCRRCPISSITSAATSERWSVIREQLGIGDDMRILCGLAIGYPDPDFPANSLDVPRNPLADNVVFVED